MFSPDLQEEFRAIEEVNSIGDVEEFDLMFGEYYGDDLERICSTDSRFLDASEALEMFKDLLPKRMTKNQAACARYVEHYLLSQIVDF